MENKDTEILRKGNCYTANSPTYTHTNINDHTHTNTHTKDITYTCDGGNLFTDQSARLHRVLHRIMKMPVTKLLNRSKSLNIKYFLDPTADLDPILKSTAAKRLFSRGSNYAMTPSINSVTRILEDLDRFEFRIIGAVMRKVLENCQPSKLKNIENALNLQHFKIPAPASISLLRKKLTIRRDWARQRGLGELTCRIRETCMTILDTITQTRTKMTRHWLQTRRRECNISKEEQDVLKHIQTLGNIRMNKLDKNLGIVVYSVSCETEAIKGHLESKNFTKLQTYEGPNMIEARQKLWDQTLQHAAGLFAEIELPEEMSKMLLQLVPHLQIRLCHMYVVWKIKAGATRPIVPSFTAPTALASKWIHEQLLPYVITIPTICMDSLAYTRELDDLILPMPWTGLIVCLDVVALYPSIPMKDSLQATMQFLKENTPLPNEAQLMIIKIMEWVIHNKYIEHENSIYHQIDGIVMGEALSVMVANIFVYEVVEETILHKWRDYILHYVRYVDDINTFMDITAAQAQDFKNDLTAQSEFINFTMDCYANK